MSSHLSSSLLHKILPEEEKSEKNEIQRISKEKFRNTLQTVKAMERLKSAGNLQREKLAHLSHRRTNEEYVTPFYE